MDEPGTRCGDDSVPCEIGLRERGLAVVVRIPGGSLFEPAVVIARPIGVANEGELVALGGGVEIGPGTIVLREAARIEGADSGAAASRLAPRGLFLRQQRSWSLVVPVDSAGRFSGSSRRLGALAVFADLTPPTIVPPASYRWRAGVPGGFSAALRDRGAGLAAADQAIYLDERRVPAEFDSEAGRLTWRPRARIASGRHVLRIEAVDRLGNRAVKAVPLEVE